ncbi:TIGR00730 family Rossman fold protein [Kiloniella sp. b19]|uniref:LOG family protein n=1 Tax=Kiloniella sp. GXU_MW_B19 TaxID=3141326 RepID=UPI0031DD8885
MTEINALCVYCGATDSVDPLFLDQAYSFGAQLARNSIALVYGGGRAGSMGRIADGALSGKGHVTGIIPDYLVDKELAHTGIDELVQVDSMHTRKMEMFKRADAFCILPGGLGTLDEFFEIVTWKQLGMHDKPVILLNQNEYWTPMISCLNHMGKTGFIRRSPNEIFHIAQDFDHVMELLELAPVPQVAANTARF